MTTPSEQSSDSMTHDFPRAGFFRRLGSWVYDALIAISVYMIAGAISFAVFALLVNLGVIPRNGEEHVISILQNSLVYTIVNECWKLGWVSFFFIYFWARSGQTVGMKAWRLKVQNLDGSLISKKTGLKRIIPTLGGIGNILVLLDWKNKLSLQDKVTATEVVVLSLAENKRNKL